MRFADERWDGMISSTTKTVVGHSSFVALDVVTSMVKSAGYQRIRLSGAGSGRANYLWNGTLPASADYEVGAEFFVGSAGFTGNSIGVTGRVDSINNDGYFLRASTFGWTLQVFTAGTYANVAPAVAQTWTPSTSYYARMVFKGSSIKVYVDGVLIIDEIDATHSAAGQIGIRCPGGATGSDDDIGLGDFWGDDGVLRPQFFDYASDPADDGSLATTVATITPPTFATGPDGQSIPVSAGQLVVIVSAYRGAGATFTIATEGGQVWHPVAFGGASSLTVHWCQFNGEWGDGGVVEVESDLFTNGTSHVMLMFDPSAAGRRWSLDIVTDLESMASSPFTLPSVTTVQPRTLNLAVWCSQDDNEWALSSEAGWQHPGRSQWRNTAGSDQSIKAEFLSLTEPATTSSPSTTQFDVGPDASTGFILSFSDNGPRELDAAKPFANYWGYANTKH